MSQQEAEKTPTNSVGVFNEIRLTACDICLRHMKYFLRKYDIFALRILWLNPFGIFDLYFGCLLF